MELPRDSARTATGSGVGSGGGQGGKAGETDAIREQLRGVQGQLKALRARGGYTEGDLRALRERLARVEARRLSDGTFRDEQGAIPPGQASLHSLLHSCHRLLGYMLQTTAVDPEYEPLLKELESVRCGLKELKDSGEATEAKLQPFQDRLRSLDSRRVNNAFAKESGEIGPGQAVLHDLLHTCYSLVDEIHNPKHPFDPSLRPVKRELEEVWARLQRWKRKGGFTSTSLQECRSRLLYLDSLRKDAAWRDEHGGIPSGQAELHGLLHRCFRLLHLLVEWSDVDSELEPALSELEDVKDRLEAMRDRRSKGEVRITGVELEDLRIALQRIESRCGQAACRTGSGAIPPGQAILHDLLYHCHSLLDACRAYEE